MAKNILDDLPGGTPPKNKKIQNTEEGTPRKAKTERAFWQTNLIYDLQGGTPPNGEKIQNTGGNTLKTQPKS